MAESDHSIKGLGEASIRVQDLRAMQKFYEDVVGLKLLREEEDYVFFKVAEGYGGHTQNLALFHASNRRFLESKSVKLSPEQTTLHILHSISRLRISNRRESVLRAWG